MEEEDGRRKRKEEGMRRDGKGIEDGKWKKGEYSIRYNKNSIII